VQEQQDDSGMSNSNSNSSSAAYNNDTYMSIDEGPDVLLSEETTCSKENKLSFNNTYISVSGGNANLSTFADASQASSVDSRVTVIEKKPVASVQQPPPERRRTRIPPQQYQKLLKRSPVVKDVVSEKKNGGGRLTGPLTIIIPNISQKAFVARQSEQPATTHDYENLALININRGAVGSVRHWRTYSDMAGSMHDESTAYDKSKMETAAAAEKKKNNADYSNCYGSLQYYDIYPLSREIKEQLYKSITPGGGALPSSTAATVAGSDTATSSTDRSCSDTYEPIETYCCK
jgi:hypothetical protein